MPELEENRTPTSAEPLGGFSDSSEFQVANIDGAGGAILVAAVENTDQVDFASHSSTSARLLAVESISDSRAEGSVTVFQITQRDNTPIYNYNNLLLPKQQSVFLSFGQPTKGKCVLRLVQQTVQLAVL